MASTVSVSKGVFAFKRPRTKKNANGPEVQTIDYWTGDNDEARSLSYGKYVKCLKIVQDITNNLQKKTHAKVFKDLVEFIERSSSDSEIGNNETSYLKDIPTACLLTGVNMPDHESIFGSLVQLVVEKVTPHVARLQSQECSTVRAAVFKMVSQLMKGIDSIDPELIDEIDSGPTVKRTQCTMAVLTSWYQELMKTAEERYSPSKGKKGKSKRKSESPKHCLESPGKVLRSEAEEYPSKVYGSPRKATMSPRKAFNSPRKAIGSPRMVVESPRKRDASPRKVLDLPRKAFGSPRKTLETLKKGAESPRKAFLSQLNFANGMPRQSVSTRDNLLETPPKKKKCDEHLSSSPGKSQRQPLVIIFEDVESFPTHVLQDLILLCSEHRCNLPFVFVFGVATTSAAVHQSLSQDASACVAMETFQAQPSTHYLNDIIDEVLMSTKVPFHLGGRTFKLLLDIFLYHDLSVNNFNRALQVCIIEHFTGNAASFLCSSPGSRKKLLKTASSAQLDIVRKLPSYRAYVESRPPNEQAALLINEKETKDTILNLLNDLEVWYARFCTLVKVVNILTCTLPQSPLGRQVREVLATCLSRALVETEEYQEVQKMLSLTAKEELLPLLNNALTLVQDESNGDEVLEGLHENIAIVIGRLNSLDQLDEAFEEPSSKDSPITIQATDRFQLKEKLKELAKKKTKKPNAYEVVRKDMLEMLDDIFRKHLQPPSSQPLHEIQFFDSSSVIKRHLIGMTRAALTTALSNPHHYLQCTCCQLDDPTNIVTSLPDVSVAYKLHIECGRLINLYDWLQAFVSVVEPDADTSSRRIDKKLQARFVQALLELQFLGFVKQTRRKTDHVARLTWGGC